MNLCMYVGLLDCILYSLVGIQKRNFYLRDISDRGLLIPAETKFIQEVIIGFIRIIVTEKGMSLYKIEIFYILFVNNKTFVEFKIMNFFVFFF
jgi:hypothetical protein